MFDELSGNLTDALKRLVGRGVLTEDAVREGLREIRRVLLEADVSFDLTRSFLERVQEKAVGQDVIKSVRPGQQVVKIVYDELVAMLGEKQAPIALRIFKEEGTLEVGKANTANRFQLPASHLVSGRCVEKRGRCNVAGRGKCGHESLERRRGTAGSVQL